MALFYVAGRAGRQRGGKDFGVAGETAWSWGQAGSLPGGEWRPEKETSSDESTKQLTQRGKM